MEQNIRSIKHQMSSSLINPKIDYRIRKTPTHDCILNQMNQV
jgi:hypothetical protein